MTNIVQFHLWGYDKQIPRNKGIQGYLELRREEIGVIANS